MMFKHAHESCLCGPSCYVSSKFHVLKQVTGPGFSSATHGGSYPYKLVEPIVSPYDFPPQVIMTEEIRTWTRSVVAR